MNDDIFTDAQTGAILEAIGIDVVGDTPTHWMVLCPFHHNTNTPAMVVDKEEGLFFCNNAACDRSGDIRRLVQDVTGKTLIQTEFLIYRARQNSSVDVAEYIKKKAAPVKFPDYPAERVDYEYDSFWLSDDAINYMTKERHFEERTLREFKVGYNTRSNLITVPMFDTNGKPVGVIGRGIEQKIFKNSVDLPKRETLFNIHNAKRKPHTIICEASFDAMRAWQATGVHAVATLGSYIGEGQASQILRHFDEITLGVDDDKVKDYKKHCRRCRSRGEDECVGHNTGFELGLSIIENAPGVRARWAHLNSIKRYDGNKDFGDLTDDQIKYAVDNAITNYEMQRRR